MDISWLILSVCVFVFTAVVAIWDIRTKKIPNALTVSGLAAALLFHLINGAVQGGFSGAGLSLLTALGGFATGFGILLVLWLIGGGGGGDVKLMGALGAWLGPGNTILVFMISSLLVVAVTMAVLAWQFVRLGSRRAKYIYLEPRAGPTRQAAGRKGQKKARSRKRIVPFGVPVALATWCVLAMPNLLEVIKETMQG